MNKQDAVKLFGSVKIMAEVLDLTPNAIYMWPDQLQQCHIDRVVGAAIRTGRLHLSYVMAPRPAEG